MVSRMRNCLVVYVSYSGNTEEVALHVGEKLKEKGMEVDLYDVTYRSAPIDVAAYDVIILGAFTWDYGSVPDEMEDFLNRTPIEHDHVAIFGSGDTQFGGEPLYCKAVDTLRRRLNSKVPGLKIEQSPRGRQLIKIDKWLERVLEHVDVINESKDVRAKVSQ